jgi:hypothetical protein
MIRLSRTSLFAKSDKLEGNLGSRPPVKRHRFCFVTAPMEFAQSSFLRGQRHITLKENSDTISVRISGGSGSREFPVDLNVLHPGTTEIKERAVAFLVPTIFFLMVACCFLVAFFTATLPGDRLGGGFLALVMGLVAFTCLRKMRRGSYHIVVFYNRFNGQPVFNLFHELPDRDSFKSFMGLMIERIKSAQDKAPAPALGADLSVPAQLENYARLANSGVISTAQFEKIRESLLEKVTGPEKQIGFGN